MLMWSLVVHSSLLTSFALGSYLLPNEQILPPPSVGMFVNLPASGVNRGSGASAPAPTEPVEPEATPEPEPEPEPKPKVVRPSKEVREEIPQPDAPVKKKQRWERIEESTGLVGADAATGDSDVLQESTRAIPGIGLGGTPGGSAFDQDFEYAYYVQQMLGRIHQHWQRVAVRGTAIVTIQFTILKDGSLSNAGVEQTSGVSVLDRAALRAVLLADPMPPLPNSYPRDSVGVHLRFTYSENY